MRSVSESLKARLEGFDSALVASYNRGLGKWVISRKTKIPVTHQKPVRLADDCYLTTEGREYLVPVLVVDGAIDINDCADRVIQELAKRRLGLRLGESAEEWMRRYKAEVESEELLEAMEDDKMRADWAAAEMEDARHCMVHDIGRRTA